jgi:hypothetical protein
MSRCSLTVAVPGIVTSHRCNPIERISRELRFADSAVELHVELITVTTVAIKTTSSHRYSCVPSVTHERPGQGNALAGNLPPTI